ncbi:SPOR domain-containing protein [Paenalcaligenes sp. Me131]|uniref:SPOR domain-containing protein n=1 Tax=Paenalcaligenes sp. Me131 TaxID=3392636 RepID=UPI003D27BB1E
MATRRKNTRSSKSSSGGGSTLFGVIIGLILGLAAAALVAFYITKAPMPFNDKASRAAPNVLLPEVRDAPDPNIGLYPRPSTTANGQPDSLSPVAPAGGTRPEKDVLGELIATLPEAAKPPAVAAPTAAATPSAAPAANNNAEPKQLAMIPPPAPPKAAASQRYFLQAGAFRSANDADATKARILMLGLPAEVQVAEVNGTTLNRVRVGPFNGLDAMNQARITLGNEQIATSVVRQP